MVEAPDSPPDASHLPAVNQLFSSISSPQQSTSNRVNGVNGETTKCNHGAPGSSWSSKKFQDEYERAYGQLLDQGWDMKKYSDPLLQSQGM